MSWGRLRLDGASLYRAIGLWVQDHRFASHPYLRSGCLRLGLYPLCCLERVPQQ